MKKTEEQEISNKKEHKIPIKLIAISIAVIVILCSGIYVIKHMKELSSGLGEQITDTVIGEEGKVYTVTESVLKKVVTTSNLYIAQYPYNSYATVYDKDTEEIKYYVAYEGTVKAGIDVNKIQVSLEEETHTITIHLPRIELEEPVIDESTLDYIFTKDKYETETVMQEAYQAAVDDLSEKIKNDSDILDSATERAKTYEKLLVESWVNQIEEETQYTVEVIAYGEEE